MIFSRVYLLPPILVVLLLGTFTVTYIIAVALDHVRAIFPYISDTGTTAPESTVFGEVLNIGAVLIYIIFYIRYQLVKKSYNNPKLPRYATVARLNRISLWIILPTAIGATMVGNFQETNAFAPHMIGAILCFVVGLIYFWLHTAISYITCPVMNTLNMARLRLTLVTISSLSFGAIGLFGVISYFSFKKTLKDIPKWGPDDGGYELHIVSSVSEWITLIFFGLFTLTFIKEFKGVVVQTPKVEKISNTKVQQVDVSSNSDSINPLDTADKRIDEDDNGNVGKTAEINRGGSKILLV